MVKVGLKEQASRQDSSWTSPGPAASRSGAVHLSV